MAMIKTQTEPLISVCIPVYETEPFLAKCLRSVYAQDFSSFEIIVVSDDSRGKDSKGRSSKKIVQQIEKEGNKYRKTSRLAPVKITFEEHHQNRGILEVRRTLSYNASGQYIFYVDSDDEIVPDALSALWNATNQNTEVPIDIVHGTFVSGYYDKTDTFIPLEHKKCGAIYYGNLAGHDIFTSWVNGNISGNVCGILILKNLVTSAFENIPYTECNMADDFLIFFFIIQQAQSYIGLPDKIYRYRINSGMSSGRKIDTLKKWQLVCSAASVFTIISTWIQEKNASSEYHFSDEEIIRFRESAGKYLQNNIRQMNDTVVPELKDQAYEMLCDFWGKEAVERFINK